MAMKLHQLNMDDHEDSSVGSNSTNASGLKANKNRVEEAEAVAKREGKLVLAFKVLTFLILVLAAIAVSVSVYRYTTNQENGEFAARFEVAGTKVLQGYECSELRCLR